MANDPTWTTSTQATRQAVHPPSRGRDMSERQFAVSGDWALGADNLQWILYRRKAKTGWRAVSFVASTRQVLERCMREKGCEPSTAKNLLAGLPDTFDAWKATRPPWSAAPSPVPADPEVAR